MMTPEQGFGMLLMGIIAITIGGTIIYLIINTIEDRKIKEEKEKKEREKVDGLN
tara:strand:+ start:324 stop:485 length:162 start_codon:yes stop_codon:yes gene_type:complete